jgi:hypothetical protein
MEGNSPLIPHPSGPLGVRIRKSPEAVNKLKSLQIHKLYSWLQEAAPEFALGETCSSVADIATMALEFTVTQGNIYDAMRQLDLKFPVASGPVPGDRRVGLLKQAVANLCEVCGIPFPEYWSQI